VSDKSVYKAGETYNNRSATESMMIGTTIVQKKMIYQCWHLRVCKDWKIKYY